MTEQEQIEVWRKEFEDILIKKFPTWSLVRLADGYFGALTDGAWQLFLILNLSQPVVELPKPNSCYDAVMDYCDKVTESLTAAGIQFKVKQ